MDDEMTAGVASVRMREWFRSRGVWRAGAFGLLLCVLSVFLYTRHNHFPVEYHWTEPSKVSQVYHDARDFRHPLLLVTTVDWACGIVGVEKTPANIALAGRWCSAIFAAIGVAALGLLALRLHGWAAALCASILLIFSDQTFEYAHYMKEDAALLMGLGLSFLAMAVYSKRPGLRAACFLGISCAVAVSGKYVGVVAILLALPLILVWNRCTMGARLRHLCTFLGGLAAAWCLFNHPALTNWSGLYRGLATEMGVVMSHQKFEAHLPFTEFLRLFFTGTTPAIWFFAGWHLFSQWQARARLSAVDWIITIFPWAVVLALCLTKKDAERYLLPAYALACYQAGIGIVDAARLLCHRFKNLRIGPVLAAGLAVAAGLQLMRFAECYRGFKTDHRAEMLTFIRNNLPKDAVVAIDRASGIRRSLAPDPEMPQGLRKRQYLSDFRSLDHMRRAWITHAIVGPQARPVWLKQGSRWMPEPDTLYQGRQNFHAEIETQGELVHEIKPGRIAFYNPGLKLYRLPDRQSMAASAQRK